MSDGYDWCDAAEDILAGEDLDVCEAARQARIAAGVEHVCVGCGCSESLSCPGGCVWASPNLCSRCAAPGREIVL